MPGGLAGFQGFDKFVLIEDPKTIPFRWFQSVQEPNLSIVIMDPIIFKPDYSIGLDKIIKDLDWVDSTHEEIAIYVVVNILGEGDNKKITANLLGPIVINSKNNTAVQVVLSDTTYSCQHNILEPEKTKK